MPRMSNTLGLTSPEGIKDPAVRELLNQWRQVLEDKYKDTFTDVHHKEWIYFDVGQKTWRMGPMPPGTDDTAKASLWNFEIQFFTGDDYANQWRNDTYWEMQWRGYGGAD